jgi:tripartite-type tricarboxylate transporter receptor subunit TctC
MSVERGEAAMTIGYAAGNFLRRIAAACGVLAGAVVCAPVAAETYPARPVTIILPFGAGSSTDACARLIAQALQDALGQSFVIENKPGANGLIAATSVARAKPDGYTLMITTNSTHSAATGLYKNVPYDPIKDFTPVARIGSFPTFLAVNPGMPINTVGELVAYAKANPGKLSYGHGNSTGQIVGEAFKKRTGVDIVRVAYRSNPAAVTDLIAGHIPMGFPDFSTGLPQVRAQKVRPLAVLTKLRSDSLPDIPTLDETVMPGFDLLAWVGMFGPADMPPEIPQKLAHVVQKALADPEFGGRLTAAGTRIFWSGPQEFSAYVKSELVKWTSLIKEAGIEPE